MIYLFGFLIFGNLADNILNPRKLLVFSEVSMATLLFIEVIMIAVGGKFADENQEEWFQNTR
jgi:hypothetical protein